MAVYATVRLRVKSYEFRVMATSKNVIPAKAGIRLRNTGFPRIKYGAGLAKPGMTIKGKRFMMHYISSVFYKSRRSF